MPNWVTNTVKAKDFEILKQKLTRVITDEAEAKDYDVNIGDRIVDFNILIPQPKELNIISGSYEYITRSYFAEDKLKAQEQLIKPYLEKVYNSREFSSQSEFFNEVKKTLATHLTNFIQVYGLEALTSDEKRLKEALENIVNGFYNLKKYGATNWYDWNVNHWGTKWNGSHARVNEEAQLITFDTAWSTPTPIFEELSKFTDVVVAYADEDIGRNYGLVAYESYTSDEGEIIPYEPNYIIDSQAGSMGEAMALQYYDEENVEEYFSEENYSDEEIKEYWNTTRKEQLEAVLKNFKETQEIMAKYNM